MDLREELPEDMARRMLKFLSVLKFQPECSIQEFQAGVITGEKGIVYSVLVWILPKVGVSQLLQSSHSCVIQVLEWCPLKQDWEVRLIFSLSSCDWSAVDLGITT